MSDKFLDAQVLLVEGDRDLVHQARAQLEPALGPIVTFVDAEAALQHLASGEKYDVLLVGVDAGGGPGLPIFERAHTANPTIQAMFFFAGDDFNDLQHARDALARGAVDLIRKPVADWEGVERSVLRALATRDLQLQRMRLMKQLMVRNEQLNRAVTLLRKSSEISELMQESRSVGRVLNILLKTASDVLEAERVSIMIRDPRHDEVAVQVAQGINEAVLKEINVRPDEGVVGQVLATGKPVVVEDAASDERVEFDEVKRSRYRTRSFMCIPICPTRSAKVMGVVNVTERTTQQPFTDIEAEFVMHLARQAAHALMTAAIWQQSFAKNKARSTEPSEAPE